MRTMSFSIALAILLVGCAPKSPIDRFLTVFSEEKSLGAEKVDHIALPASARPQLVVERAIEQHHKGKILHEVIEFRENLNINGRNYTAVLVATNTGQEVALVRYDEREGGWWWYVHPVSERKP
jgi:hypothetical protein